MGPTVDRVGSFKEIDRSHHNPPYRQIANMLREAIVRGYIPVGDKLPSEAALIQGFGVARMTVRRALKELSDEGLVHAVHGRGVFVQQVDQPDGVGSEIQAGLALFSGRSHTEISRLIAHDIGSRIAGESIIEPAGQGVATNVEELARKALALGWFDADGTTINWSRFARDASLNAQAIRNTLV
jgi:DNA-binding GntR family transcriptional regulator